MEKLKEFLISKQKEKKEAQVAINTENPFHTKNPDQFNGKRFKRMPRFAIWRNPDGKKNLSSSYNSTLNPQLSLESIPCKISQGISSLSQYYLLNKLRKIGRASCRERVYVLV